MKSIRKIISTVLTVAVVVGLCAVCTISFFSRKAEKTSSEGRVISVSDLYYAPAHQNAYYKITYDEMDDLRLTPEEKAKKAENAGSKDAAAGQSADVSADQKERDRLALQSLMESNSERAKESEATRKEIKARENKYKINDITEVQVQTVEVAGVSPIAVPVLGTTDGAEYLGEFSLTAYCPCMICCGNTSGITASGARATANHTIAADSRFPFGTKLLINGVVYTVEDRGGAIQGNIIDIFFCTHEEACQFGRQSAHVYRIP